MDDLVVEIVKFAPAVVCMAWIIVRQDKRIDRLLDMLEQKTNSVSAVKTEASDSKESLGP